MIQHYEIAWLNYLGCLLAILLLLGCEQTSTPKGVVATVNGEPIFLHTIQTLLDSRSAALGIPPRPSLDEMKSNYGQALTVLIIHALVRQELKARKIDVKEADFQKILEDIRNDYGTDDFDKFLADSSLRKDDWQQLMFDSHALDIFNNQLLSPGVKIGLDEIKNYYQEHKKDFYVPESWHLCFLTSEDKNKIDLWCSDLENLEFSNMSRDSCMDVKLDEIPPKWLVHLKKSEPMTCTKAIEENGEWQAIALLKKDKAREISLPQSYALIENIILDKKKEDAFNQWLEKRIKTVRIKVSPELAAWLGGKVRQLEEGK